MENVGIFALYFFFSLLVFLSRVDGFVLNGFQVHADSAVQINNIGIRLIINGFFKSNSFAFYISIKHNIGSKPHA